MDPRQARWTGSSIIKSSASVTLGELAKHLVHINMVIHVLFCTEQSEAITLCHELICSLHSDSVNKKCGL